MKLQDKETLSIATAVKDVLEKKEVKEINYPHKMYSPEGEEVTANDKQEHEAYSVKGYTHDKPVKEVKEGTISEAKNITIKTSILKNADWDGSRDEKENPKGLTIQQFIKQEAKKYRLSVKFQVNKGSMQGQSSDLMLITGSVDNLIKYFNEYYDARIKRGDEEDLMSFSENTEKLDAMVEKRFNEDTDVNEVYLSGSDLKKAQKIVNDPKTKGGNHTQAMKDLEKWKKGSSDHKKVQDMLRIAHESVEVEEELTAGQKKLPPALQKAILKKQGKKEEVKETDEVDESEKQKKYQAFFKKALDKFGVKSPAELDSDEKKKEFFDYIDKNYDSESE